MAAAITGFALLTTPAIAADQQPPKHLYGPEPSWDQFRTIAEADIRQRMLDPDSARITWISGIQKGDYKPILEGRVYGYVACGTVNARNRFGGYAGTASFAVVIDYDRVLLAAIDKGNYRETAVQCSKALADGRLPPLPSGAGESISTSAVSTSEAGQVSATTASAPSSAPLTLTSAGSGLTLSAMPDGAYIRAVTPGSSAAAAGLKPGMVIANVNAIPLAGMGDAMLKVVDAAGATASLGIVGGRTVKLGARP